MPWEIITLEAADACWGIDGSRSLTGSIVMVITQILRKSVFLGVLRPVDCISSPQGEQHGGVGIVTPAMCLQVGDLQIKELMQKH